MARSTMRVAPEILDMLRKRAPEMGFEVVCKLGYKHKPPEYLIGIAGPAVPNCAEVVATFTRHEDKSISVEFTPVTDANRSVRNATTTLG